MNNTVEVIQTALTADYIPNWTVAKGIKEATQNIVFGAIKANEKPEIVYTDGMGIIEDSYNGFEKKHLYLGQSGQREDENGLGSFGEGWKMFLLIAARNGLHHRVHTVGFTFYGEMVDTPHGVQALNIIIESTSRSKGTQVEIHCSQEDFNKGTEGFAFVEGIEQEYCTERNIIPNRNHELYIHGILIESDDGNKNPLELEFAYHIKDRSLVNRDRSQVNNHSCMNIISSIWSYESNADLVKQFITKALEGNISQDVQNGPRWFELSYSPIKQTWIDTIVDSYMAEEQSKLLIPSKNQKLDNEAVYRGFTLIQLPDKWTYTLKELGFQRVEDVIIAPTSDFALVSEKDLLPFELDNLRKAKSDVRKAHGLGSIKMLPEIRIAESLKSDDVYYDPSGLYDKRKRVIYLKREILMDRSTATQTLLHESVHWSTNGAEDNSTAFTRGFERVCLTLLGFNANGYKA